MVKEAVVIGAMSIGALYTDDECRLFGGAGGGGGGGGGAAFEASYS